MSMMIGSGYEKQFTKQVKKDFKEINNLPVSPLNSLDDIKNGVGKSFKTADIEKLMEKYDPASYEKYKNGAYRADGGHSYSGLDYLSKWMDDVKSGKVTENNTINRSNDISAQNEEKLSKKAQDFLKRLREQNSEFDFMIGNSTDDLKALSKSGCKEFSVIFSSAEIERMANDEKYADEKLQGVAGAVRMAYQIAEENGFKSAFDAEGGANGVINKIGVVVDDDGNMKLFAELEKNSAKQKERIEKQAEEKASERTNHKNPYAKDEKSSVKRTTVEADTIEELLDKISNVDWEKIEDIHSGDRVDFTV